MGRFLAILVIALALAWCVYANYLASPISGDWGFQGAVVVGRSGTMQLADARVVHVRRVFPGTPAARAGIKPGDITRALVPRGRLAEYPAVGQIATFEISRGKMHRTVTLTAAGFRFPRHATEGVIFACELVALALALLLVLRRWEDPAARALILFLVCQSTTFASGLLPGEFYGFIRPFQLFAIFLGYAGLVRFTATYPTSVQPARFRKFLAVWGPALALFLAVLWFADSVAEVWFTSALALRPEYRYASLLFADALPALGLVTGLVAIQGAERKRVAILLAFFLASITGPIAYDVILANSNIAAGQVRPLLATLVIMYGGFVYVVLRHRLFDIGFVVNRAAIYAVLTSILVPAFALLEWLAERYVSAQNRTENVLVQAGIVLVLFLSIRQLQTYVEHFVDTVIFRERHENETAIRDFARQVLFITDARTIGERTVHTVCSRTAAGWSAIYMQLDDAKTYALGARCGEYLPPVTVSENDAAVLSMRTNHAVVEHLRGSAFDDALVLPLLARGQVTGFVVCGPKTTNETYAPDECDALLQVARGVAAALESLRLAELEEENRTLRARLAPAT